MADFCKQCSIDLFGEDYGDLAKITSIDAWKDGQAMIVLCEECGPIQVDPEGNCVSNCSHDGEAGHNLPWLVDNDEEKL